jgi:hypothetical protein
MVRENIMTGNTWYSKASHLVVMWKQRDRRRAWILILLRESQAEIQDIEAV